MRSRIMRTPLTLERSTGGELNSDNEYIDNTPVPVAGLFSIQPYKQGSREYQLPEGIKTSDALILLGVTPVKEADQFERTKADRVLIDSRYYIADNVANWARHGSNADHYTSIFIREDKLSQQRQS
tara:strand:+ start:128 stop:505 length:378 start_codon:yes stop_codon:yes gene_type:complete